MNGKNCKSWTTLLIFKVLLSIIIETKFLKKRAKVRWKFSLIFQICFHFFFMTPCQDRIGPRFAIVAVHDWIKTFRTSDWPVKVWLFPYFLCLTRVSSIWVRIRNFLQKVFPMFKINQCCESCYQVRIGILIWACSKSNSKIWTVSRYMFMIHA